MKFFQTHKESLFDTRKSNPMVSLPLQRVSVGKKVDGNFITESAQKHKKVLSKAKKNQTEFGLNTLLYTDECLKWSYMGQEICSPIYFSEVNLIRLKGSTQMSAEISNLSFPNPVLEYLLKKEFNIDLKDSEFETFLSANNFTIQKEECVFNYDYKKYILVRDYNKLQDADLSPVLNQIVQGDTPIGIHKDEEPQLILPLDESQKKCVSAFGSGQNLIIEGPPGTGKSRTIASMIGHNLLAQKSTLFVAQKRSALQVVSSIFKSLDLDWFVSIIHDSEKDKKRFVNELKATWEKLNSLETKIISKPLITSQFGFYLEKLNSKIKGSNLTFNFIIDRIKNNPAEYKKTDFSPSIHFMEEWISKQKEIQQSYDRIAQSKYQNFYNSPLQGLNQKLFYKNDIEELIESNLSQLISYIENLEKRFDVNYFSTIERLISGSTIARLMSNFNQTSLDSFLKITSRNRFKTLRKQWIKLNNKQEELQSFYSLWRNPWSKQEISHAQEALSKDSFFKSKRKKIELTFSQDFEQKNIELPISQVLEQTLEYIQISENINTIEAELLSEFNLTNPSINLSIYYEIIVKIDNDEEFISYLKQNKKKAIVVQNLDKSHGEIQQVLHYGRQIFDFEKNKSLAELKEKSISLLETEELKPLLSVVKSIGKNCSKEIFSFIISSKDNYGQIDKSICSEFYRTYSQLDFIYDEISEDLLYKSYKKLIDEEKELCSYHVEQIFQNSIQKLKSFNLLLETPAVKLSPEQKELKKELRRGKTILTKEFSKSRQHKSIRELYDSDAKHWVEVLKPVLFLSPISVSEIFTLESQFEILIFDESSQIPFEDCIPSLQRTKQIIIAGDSQQMPPSTYFQSNTKEQFSLLDYCKFEFNSFSLKYHYRAKNKALMSWSNQHFYNNSLHIIDSFENKHQPFEFIQLENNDYLEGKNISEAKSLVNYIQKHWNKFKDLSVGIVALSEGQKNLIIKELEPIAEYHFLKENIFVKSLENLQGDECDILIISLTHGLNQDGQFSRNFGPINQYNGKKRLNVLFSRSKLKTILFCSFPTQLLSYSDNEGIKFLHSFLNYAKTFESSQAANLKGDKEILDPHIEGGNLDSLLSQLKQYELYNWNPTFKLSKSNL